MTDEPSLPLDSPIDVARLQAIYSGTAAFYDGLVATLQARAKELAIEVLRRLPGERFLEVGVGTAWAFARIVSDTGATGAYGIDVAPGMLDVAASRLADEAGLTHPPLLLGDARSLPFRDGVFDCLLTTYTLEVLPNAEMPALLRECHRVLRPGGRIVLVNLTEGEGDDAAMTDDWKRRYAIDPEYFGGARPLRSAPLLEAAGFIEIVRRYIGPEWPSEVITATAM